MCRPLPAGTALILAALVARAAADDDPTRAKLDQAKAAYGRSTERHRREVGEWFDGQVEKARGQKDKKAKDRLDEDRAAFDNTGLLPATAPKGLRDQGKAGRDALDRAFLAAVGDYTRGGKDKEAAATEREFVAFVRKSSAPRIAGRWARDRDGAVIAATANHEVAEYWATGKFSTKGTWAPGPGGEIEMRWENGWSASGEFKKPDVVTVVWKSPRGELHPHDYKRLKK